MEIKTGTTGLLAGPNAVWKLIAVFILVNVVLIGTLGLIGAFGWKSAYLKFVGVPADGVIVDFKFSIGTEAGAAVVEYDVDGQIYTIDGPYYDLQPNVKGDHIEVIYAPSDPNIAQVGVNPIGPDELITTGGAIFLALCSTDILLLFLIGTRIFLGPKNKVPA